MVTCLFDREDTIKLSAAVISPSVAEMNPSVAVLRLPATVMSLSVEDVAKAEQLLNKLLRDTPKEDNAPPMPGITSCYTPMKSYTLYVLPRNTLFAQLTGIAVPNSYTYACFYADRLLLAPDAGSLTDYIHLLEKKEVYDDTEAYEKGVSGLSDSYHFMMIADLGQVFNQPENYVRLIPNFFFRSPDFFRHFVLSAQFACNGGVAYPNIVLTYKGEGE